MPTHIKKVSQPDQFLAIVEMVKPENWDGCTKWSPKIETGEVIQANECLFYTLFTCDQCGEKIEHESSHTTGYGINDKGEKICFQCCGKNDAQELANLPMGGKMVLYLTSEINEENAQNNPYQFRTGNYREAYREHFVTNWPGTLKIRVYWPRKSKHNFARNRYDVWFEYSGNKYWGVQYGDFTQILHVKRVKQF